jgi:hypothetical protein
VLQTTFKQTNTWQLKAHGGVSYNNVLVLVVADFAILVRASATMANSLSLSSVEGRNEDGETWDDAMTVI